MPGTASFRSALEDALPERPFRVVLWDGSEVPPTQPNGGPTFTATSPQALAHVLRAPGSIASFVHTSSSFARCASSSVVAPREKIAHE